MNDASDRPACAPKRFMVGDRVLDLQSQELSGQDGTAVELRPQAWRVLEYLALRPGELVRKEELLEAVWPGLIVTDDSLVQAIGDIRRALGDAQHRIVKTVPKRGYLLNAAAVQPLPAVHERTHEHQGRPVHKPPTTELPAAAPADDPNAAAASGSAAAGKTAPTTAGPASSAPGRHPTLTDSVPGPSTSTNQASRRPRRALMASTLLGLAALMALAYIAWRTSAADSPVDVAASRPPDRPTIAVLTFQGEPGSLTDQTLARGFAEDLVRELARNIDLRVVSHQSSFVLSDRGLAPEQIGQQLRVRYFVEGSARREGERLQIRASVVDARSGRVVWAERYTAEAADLPRMRDDLVWRIAGSVHSSMRHSEERRSLAPAPVNMDVYSAVLRAIALKHLFQPEPMREARRLLEQATRADPQYAPAWLYLGMVNAIDAQTHMTGEMRADRIGETIKQVERAIALDPRQPQAYGALSLAMRAAGRWRDALQAADRCVQLGPNDADCLFYQAKSRLELGDVQGAQVAMAQALELTPLPPVYMQGLHAGILWALEQHADALREADECLRKAPYYLSCRWSRLGALVGLDRLDEAREEGARVRRMLPGGGDAAKRLGAQAYSPEATELLARRLSVERAAGLVGPPDPAAHAASAQTESARSP